MQVIPARFLRSVICAAGLALAPVALPAQGLFSPAILVDEMVITTYEIQQRARMIEVLNSGTDPISLAREQLVDDRLRLQAAKDAGIVPTDEELRDGMTEFAQRGNLSLEQFVGVLAQNGVEEQTFRDFVRAGFAWRQLVQQRFQARTNVSDEEVDRALSGSGTGSNVRVLLSELIIPIRPGTEQQVQSLAERISQYRSTAEFSAAAREYSATATRGEGGRLPWQDLSELPPVLRPLVIGLSPGEVTAPIPIPGAVALFQMRQVEETGYSAPEIASVDYATYYMAGGRSPETLAKARVLASKVDRCDDLYGYAKGQPAEVLQRQSMAPSELPTDIAYELSKLDPGEISTALTRSNGQTLMVLMLCGRTASVAADADRQQVTIGLRNQRLNQMAEAYLAQLRANAHIVEK
ncbi:peptidylprolyl isomerase [Salipiger mangrovisoli]|uniref:Parvulin-like PPIase n=1 Tax=Salipiger mangrovisoli TaxID=2865933 RepID=A0ABR9WWQ9_9RHOB|nr:peptidylprolyl isomerase [Salipiger mangrovisoli]MBE9635685.1 SurA N-terminal domain-containing protein [Salipiger mangrovisoli]